MQPHRIPSLNWLRVFDAAARHQSFASAGRELNMSAAAVSQQILALETYLKKPLFLRSANKVRLTLEGNEFLPTIQVSSGPSRPNRPPCSPDGMWSVCPSSPVS